MKDHVAVRTKTVPDWNAWSSRASDEREDIPWSEMDQNAKLDLEVVDSLDELQSHIPGSLFDAIEQSLNSPEVEILDI